MKKQEAKARIKITVKLGMFEFQGEGNAERVHAAYAQWLDAIDKQLSAAGEQEVLGDLGPSNAELAS